MRARLPRQARPDAGEIDKAAKRLAAAKTPVLLLGGGALDAGKEALQIAEALGAPILTTTAGKGAVPANHALSLGYRLTQPVALDLLRKSDAILCVGSELSETDFWSSDVILDKNLIRIDIDEAALARPHTADIAILGDAKAALAGIVAALPKADGARRKESEALAQGLREDGS